MVCPLSKDLRRPVKTHLDSGHGCRATARHFHVSPDLNPIELAFSKLKAYLRKFKARTYEELGKTIGNIGDLFSSTECWNFFRHFNYKRD